MSGTRKWALVLLPLLLVALAVLVSAAPAPAVAADDAKPPEVIALDQLPPESAQATALLKSVYTEIDAYSARMIEMNDWLYKNPEAGHQEFKANEMLTGELKKAGFEVTFGVKGLEKSYNDFITERYNNKDLATAYVAKYKGKSEHPVIGFVVEEDALRGAQGPFHGCQHNQQGPVGVGAAIALSKVMEQNKLAGSVWVIMTPAEEIPPPNKVAMAKAGIFDDVDFVIRSHGTPPRSQVNKAGLGNCCMLIEAVLYDFKGQTSHGMTPWLAKDALDAATLFFDGVNALRGHSENDFRFMGTITRVGGAPNVINDNVQVDHWVRNANPAGQDALNKKVAQVDAIAKGAAMMTGTEVNIRHYGSYYNAIESGWLNALARNYVNQLGEKAAISDELSKPSGWDEGGYAAFNVPGISIQPAVAGVPEVPGHSVENANISISEAGHKGLVQTAKIEAAVALRLVLDPALRDKVTAEQKAWQQYAIKNGLATQDMLRVKK
jgi:amidohydrolase